MRACVQACVHACVLSCYCAHTQKVPGVSKKLVPGVPILHYHTRFVTPDGRQAPDARACFYDKRGYFFPRHTELPQTGKFLLILLFSIFQIVKPVLWQIRYFPPAV